jgi:hypothetical protein
MNIRCISLLWGHHCVTEDYEVGWTVNPFPGSYSNLRLAIHSNAMSQLEAAQEQLTSAATSDMNANRLAAAQLAATHNKLVAPIIEANTSKVVQTAEGGERSELVNMSVLVSEFKARVEEAAAELDRLRKSHDEAQSEIDALWKDIHSGPGSSDTIDYGLTSAIMEMESNHGTAVAEFRAELETLVADDVAEMKEYEKVSAAAAAKCRPSLPCISFAG